MCGICGIINKDPARPVSLQTLEKMAHKIFHRGPDDEGYFIDRNFGIASRRLSIIDIDGGHQPMFNENGSIAVVFNGEIYNHDELKKNLKQKGHRFRSRCDTEVLVHLYEEYSLKMVDYLNGMFAFCVYDIANKKIILARDRLGIKPLYYVDHKDFFLFGSEIKSFFMHPGFDSDLDMESLHHYLSFRFVPAPGTILAAVKKMPPGTLIDYKPLSNDLKIHQYWDLNFNQDNDHHSFNIASEKLKFLIHDSVKKRLMSDVPLGAMLSGGVDSSTIVSSLANLNSQMINTFTVDYEEEGSHNEGTYAEIVARAFKTQHHSVNVNLKSLEEDLNRIVYYMDEPIADPAALPIFDLCHYSAGSVKVLLSGIGGDELFAGYNGYKEALYISLLKHMPDFFYNKIIYPLYNFLPDGVPGKNFVFRINQPVENFYLGSSYIYGGFSESEKSHLYNSDIARNQSHFNSHGVVQNLLAKVSESSILHKMMYLDTKFWLADSHLLMMDKMSMANSLELRAPLLDHRLVEFAANIPERYKLRIFNPKAVLKNAFKSDIPKSILKREKKGFSTPINIWLDSCGNEIIESLFARNNYVSDLFDKRALVRLLKSHTEGKGDYSANIFSILVLNSWLEKYNNCSINGR